MAGTTRAKAKEDFKYLIEEVLDVKEDIEFNSVIRDNKINTIPDILQLSSRLINKMEYRNSDGVSQPIPNNVDGMFCVIKQWNLHLIEKHNLTTVDWSDINIVNAESYDQYRTGTDFNPELSFQSLAISKPIAVKQHDNVAQNFQKGIKRDQFHRLRRYASRVPLYACSVTEVPPPSVMSDIVTTCRYILHLLIF